MHVGRKVIDTCFSACFADEDEEQREVNASVHPCFLNAPSPAQQVIRNGLDVTNRRSLDLRQISAEVTDHVSAFEIGRKSPEGAKSLAAWTCTFLDDDKFASFSKLLTDGSQIMGPRPSSADRIGHLAHLIGRTQFA